MTRCSALSAVNLMMTVESEEPAQEHLAELFARTRPDCVLDVGANEGQYGRLLRAHGYRGWIVSFEPVAGAFEQLVEVAGRDRRWRVFRLALGAHTELRRIAVAEVSQLSSFRKFTKYASAELPGASAVTHTEDVEIRTLNDVWNDSLGVLPRTKVFLKLDTQGWDLEVLKGANDVFEQLVGLQLEASLTPVYEGVPTFAQMVEHVASLGFDLTGVFPVNRDSLFRLIEVDCVFINSHHPDAETWRKDTWATLTERFRDEVASVIPLGARFVLIDDSTLGIDDLSGRSAIPFLERDGEYYGAPEDGAQAVEELARQASRGVRHLAIGWPSFWWLDEYPELARHLHARWHRLAATEAAIVYELGPEDVRREAPPTASDV